MESYFSILELVGKGAWAVFGDLERAAYTVIGAAAIFIGLWLHNRNLVGSMLLLGSGGFAVIFPLAGYHLGTVLLVYAAAYVLALATSLSVGRLRAGA
jgi:hypothetical protein